ncbi:hypothetical protein [Azospirillum sp. A39]|uniref:hypothetical protein n=1 Tax=Azospirillum sp. A39 TaxID=3462279 RepID=UPI0040461430
MNRVWLMPGALAAVSFAGLAAAILGDGLWDWLCWIGLSVPLAVCGHKLWRQWPAR